MTSLAEHLDLVLAMLGLALSLLGCLGVYLYKQVINKIELVGSERRGTAQEARDTKEQLIRLSERLEGYIRVQDRLVEDFKIKWERSDTLHMQILVRLGKLLNGKGHPGTPLDSIIGEPDGRG